MYKLEIIENISKEEWNQNLIKSNYSTYYQTSEYIEGNNTTEYFPIFIQIINDKDQVVGQLGIQIIKTSVRYSSSLFNKILKIISSITKRGIWLYGPIIHSENEKERLEILQIILDANNQIMKKYDLVFLEGYSPPLDIQIDEKYLKIFEKNQYQIGKYITYITDLRKSIDEIWLKIQKYTKVNVKRAMKRGIIIKKLETISEAKENMLLFKKWSETKGLTISDTKKELDKFWKGNNSGYEKTFLAYKNEQLVASITISCFNKIIIPLQVINSYSQEAKNLAGPSLTWQAIKDSKETNFEIYDITGGPMLSENESDIDNTYSLTHYKRKWGGEEHIHYNFLKINKKISYMIYLKLFKLIKWYHQRSNNY